MQYVFCHRICKFLRTASITFQSSQSLCYLRRNVAQEICHWPGITETLLILNGIACFFVCLFDCFVRASKYIRWNPTMCLFLKVNWSTNLRTVPKMPVRICILLTCPWALILRQRTDKNNIFWWKLFIEWAWWAKKQQTQGKQVALLHHLKLNSKEKARGVCVKTLLSCATFWTECYETWICHFGA